MLNGGIIRGVYNYTIEGARQKEEIIVKITETELFQKRGELIEIDGVLMLKNPEEAVFREPMARVDCELE